MELWKPELPDGAAPLYERIVDAMERDMRAGRLPAGARLPPHRDLAHALAVSIGTVTKAYGEAQRRGLLSGQVGRGSFIAGASVRGVASLTPANDGPIDLSRNLPPPASSVHHLIETLGRLRRRPELALAASYTVPEGLPSVRRAAAEWLRRRHGVDFTAESLLQSNGSQHGLALAFGAACRPGDTILVDAATFHGMKALADIAGYRLLGVSIDEGGLSPAALDQAAAASGARCLYTIPTLHNPTTITLSAERRAAIAEVARRRDLTIVEDDAYRATADAAHRPATFAEIAPERTIYVATLSKGLSPGLRLGFIRPPSVAIRERVLRAIRATAYTPPALEGLVFAQWLEDGVADQIADEILAEMAMRTDLARQVFGSRIIPVPSRQTLHVWLPLSPLDAERAAGRALRAGVEVTPPDAPIVSGELVSGLRVCLGGAASLAQLAGALDIVSQALRAEVDGRGIV